MVAPIINFSGISSGIDSASLIDALISREREARVRPLEQKASSIKDTNDSLGKLADLIGNFKSAAEKFRLVNGGALSKLGTSSDETVLATTASSSANSGAYSLTVNQLARNATYTLASNGTTYTSADQAINANINDTDPNRDVTITVGNGADQEAVSINLTSATTLNQFVSEFNATSTKAVASVVNVGSSSSPDYRVVITSNNTGLSKGELAVSVGSEISDPDGNALTDDGAFNSNTVSQATDAEFSISGIGNITRSTNSVSDVLPGLTFELKGLGDATVKVEDDASGTAAVLQKFVDAYNDLKNYIDEQDAVTEEGEGTDKINVFGPLATSSIDENLLSLIRTSFSNASKSGGEVNTLADLGITTERDGTLKFDSAILSEALSKEPTSVRTITENLGESLASTTGTLAQFTQFNGIIDQAKTSNSSQITDIQDRITDIEAGLSKQEESLYGRFSRLEALIGQLQSKQTALTSILPK